MAEGGPFNKGTNPHLLTPSPGGFGFSTGMCGDTSIQPSAATGCLLAVWPGLVVGPSEPRFSPREVRTRLRLPGGVVVQSREGTPGGISWAAEGGEL